MDCKSHDPRPSNSGRALWVAVIVPGTLVFLVIFLMNNDGASAWEATGLAAYLACIVGFYALIFWSVFHSPTDPPSRTKDSSGQQTHGTAKVELNLPKLTRSPTLHTQATTRTPLLVPTKQPPVPDPINDSTEQPEVITASGSNLITKMLIDAAARGDATRAKAIEYIIQAWPTMKIVKATGYTEVEVDTLRESLRTDPKVKEQLVKYFKSGGKLEDLIKVIRGPLPELEQIPIQLEPLKLETELHFVAPLPDAPIKRPYRKRNTHTSDVVPSVDLTPSTEGDRVLVTRYEPERSPRLRAAALSHHGSDCLGCGTLYKIYGEEFAKKCIDVHHLKPISVGERETNPKTDLVPLCKICHVVADGLPPPYPTTIEDLVTELKKRRIRPKNKRKRDTPLD